MASILLLWAGICRAAGATDTGNSMVLANLDRTGWPDALTSQANMDTALRAEVLMFGKALLASEALDEPGLKQRLGVQDVKLKSVRQVRDGLWDRLLATYRSTSQNCDGRTLLPSRAQRCGFASVGGGVHWRNQSGSCCVGEQEPGVSGTGVERAAAGGRDGAVAIYPAVVRMFARSVGLNTPESRM